MPFAHPAAILAAQGDIVALFVIVQVFPQLQAAIGLLPAGKGDVPVVLAVEITPFHLTILCNIQLHHHGSLPYPALQQLRCRQHTLRHGQQQPAADFVHHVFSPSSKTAPCHSGMLP
jgi:hypothetical protein